jgi:integrase
MASVRKIKNRGGWFLDYRLRDGTRVIKKAERELALITADILRKPGLGRLQKILFGKLCDRYLEEYCKPNHNSWRTESYTLNRLKSFFKPDTWAHTVTTYQVEQLKAPRAKERKPATVNRDLAITKRLFEVARQWGHIYENPAKSVKISKRRTKETVS